jgi:hypothetical protein
MTYECVGGPYDGESREFFEDEESRFIYPAGPGYYVRRGWNGRVCMVWTTRKPLTHISP